VIEASHAVLLKGSRIGSILQRGDVARFVFDPGYWDNPNRNVLGLWFEDDPRRSPQAALQLPQWFSNLLPEGTLRDAIARFDRDPSGQRIHIEDLAQVRGFYDTAKYTGSFETVGALTYRNHDRASLREFVRRLTFNVLIGNGDAHLKNWSLIYLDGRVPSLSPAYDLVSTAPYASPYEPDDFGLSFGGTKVLDRVGHDAFRRFQLRLGVGAAEVSDVVTETVERFEAAWPDAQATFPPFVARWIENRRAAVIARLASASSES
jgi:HipA-like protein